MSGPTTIKNEYKNSIIMKEVIKIAGPVLIELLLGTLFGMVDMIMLGNYGTDASSAAAIAAVGVTNQVILVGLSLVQSLNIGATAMVARYMGAEQEERIEDVLRHIIVLTQIFLVIPMLFIGLKYTNQVMGFMGAHADTIEIGRSYFRIIIFGFIFQAFNFSVFASMRGSGDTKTPMMINIAVNLLNVFGNMGLIYGLFGLPELGVTGAAISTVLSQIVASIILLKYIFSPDNLISIDIRKKFRLKKDVIANLVRIGVPAALEQIALRVGVITFVKIVASLGTEAYATHQIALNIKSLSFTPGQAFGIAASTLAGRSLGEGSPNLAEKYILGCKKIGSLIATAIAVVFFFFGGHIASLYTNNINVISQTSDILKLMAFIQPFQSTQLILAGGLRGAGDTVWTLVSTFIGVLIVRLILARYFVLKLGMGLIGAWLAIFVDQFVRWALVKYRFNRGRWKLVELQ